MFPLLLTALAAATSFIASGVSGSSEIAAATPRFESSPTGLAWSITASGVEVTCNESGRSHTVGVRTRSFGRDNALRELAPAHADGHERSAQRALDGLTEWYEARDDGLEHGWTLHARPVGESSSPVWIQLEFTGDLTPSIREGRRAMWLVDRMTQLRIRYDGLHAWDANGTPVEACFATSSVGVGVRIDDSGARYPITVDPTFSSPPVIFNAPNAGIFGVQVSTAGDVNGDGFSDVLITASGENANTGRAYVYHGSPAGISTTPAWSYTPGQAGAFFGAAASTAGDVNDDGYDDVIIGAPNYDIPGPGNEGQVWLFLGSITGLAAAPSWTWSSGVGGSEFGAKCRTAGDVNNDGRDDVIIGAQSHSSPGLTINGAAWLFFGTASGDLGTTPAWSAFGTGDNHEFGSSVTCAGDLDGDGYDDIAVAARNENGGQVRVYRGSATGTLTTGITLTPTSTGPSIRFGSQIACAGDTNGDGYADLVVGAHRADVGGINTGNAYLFRGRSVATGTISTTEVWWNNGNVTNGTFGDGVGPAGDVNGDGFADLVIGESSFAANIPGKAHVLLGQPGTTSFIQEVILTGAGPGPDSLGSSVCTAGDVNGDGFADVLIGAPNHGGNSGRAHLLYGEPKPDSTRFERTFSAAGAASAAGTAVAMGDVDADGYADVLVGEPNYTNGQTNEGIVRYFKGNPGTIGSVADWSRQSDEAGAHLGASVAFLGDVDGDGRGDVLVGAPDASHGELAEGEVRLYLGTSTGPSLTAQEFQSNAVGARLGASVSAAGDVNGDGLADAVVGAPGAWLGNGDAGSLHVFLGRRSPPGLVPSPGGPLSPGLAGAKFGHAVAGAGDLNGDGYSDVVVGAPGFANLQAGEGAVYLYRGSPTGLVATPEIYESNSSGAEFGFAVATAGDLNEDHLADVLVGAPGWDFLTKGGFAFVFSGQSTGSLLNPTPLHSIHFNQGGARTGAAVAYAGDLNGDNHADVLIGAPRWDDPATDTGRVAIFLGTGTLLAGASTAPASSATASIPAEDHTAGQNDLEGAALAAAGDLHGDGFGDIVVGAPGAGDGETYVYAGGNGVTATRIRTQQRRHDDTEAIAILGHSETATTFGVSAHLSTYSASSAVPLHPGTVAGREDVLIVCEPKAFGVYFDGTGSIESALSDSSDPALAVVRIPLPITGLQQDTNYRWRLRQELRNPYFPHSRWFILQGNSQLEKKVGTAEDCDGDGLSDQLEIQGATAQDCDLDGLPDDCEIQIFGEPDCNNNGSPDNCDLFFGDCNGNLVPDECELPAPGFCPACIDCNANGNIDSCDVLVDGMIDTNGDLVPDACQSGGVSVFCSGDGTATTCPCGNSGSIGNGCGSSLFSGGANLSASGIPRVTFDNFKLLGSNMPNSSALYFQGTGQQNGGIGSVFGDGLRCASGAVIRLGTKMNTGNASQYPAPGDSPISIRGVIPAPGGTRTYQCWYRNAAAFCTASTFNLTNGLSVTWSP